MLQGKGLRKTYCLEGNVDVKAVSLFKPSGIYTCLYLHGVPNYMIGITTNLHGKGLMKI